MIPSQAEAAEIQQHIFELERWKSLQQTVVFRGEVMTQQAGLGAMIASLLLKSGQKIDKATADVLTDDYFDALEDIPAWAVREALRRWNRGESATIDPKQPHDFRWAPKPPVLRKLAEFELAKIQSRIRMLQRLCDAVALVEYSDEHRAGMLERLSNLFHARAMPAPEASEAA